MNDILKKGFFLGLGAAITGKEKLEQKLSDLVEKNELTTEQAKSVMNDFIEKGEETKAEWGPSQSKQTQQLATELLEAKADINELKGRVRELEAKHRNDL